LHRSADRFQVGPSSITWNGSWLEIRIHEITVPIPRPLRGTIRIHPPALGTQSYRLDPQGKHHWWPVAPDCPVEVSMDQPALSWKGRGYFDSNCGSEPLEAGFSDWDWSRAPLPGGGCAVLYDKRLRDGSSRAMALRFDRHGEASELPLPEPTRLATTTIWRIPRETRSEAGPPARVLHTLEDTPFYARSLVEASIAGARVQAFHESLLLDRFNSRWVQTLLPFRMPRNTRAFPEG
jgi:carotenoid 1,2-hydratase